jgi:hypothetical protein
MIANMVNVEFSDRGLAPHKFMPMLGVHPALKPTRFRYAPAAGLALRWAYSKIETLPIAVTYRKQNALSLHKH